MAIARKRQISLVDTKYYHCISRCVRRAFLCGEDRFTGQSFEHRRGWVEDKLIELAKVFCIDVCAYAVMSNHTHLVLYVDDKKANRLNDKAIVIRWHKLCKGTLLTQKYVQGEKLSKTELIFCKRGYIESTHLPLLERVNISPENWLKLTTQFTRVFHGAVGRTTSQESYCEHLNRKRRSNVSNSEKLLG